MRDALSEQTECAVIAIPQEETTSVPDDLHERCADGHDKPAASDLMAANINWTTELTDNSQVGIA